MSQNEIRPDKAIGNSRSSGVPRGTQNYFCGTIPATP
jgi:hypothetical protein